MITLKAELFHACFGSASVPARCHVALGRSPQSDPRWYSRDSTARLQFGRDPSRNSPSPFDDPLPQLRLSGFDGSETLLRFGMASKTELRLTIPDYFGRSGMSSGFGDPIIGMKQQLSPAAASFNASLVLSLSLPAGARDISSFTVTTHRCNSRARRRCT
jgi:hypothetical protein